MKYCNTLIIKIASRCNINCTYCYMYNHADNSYKKQPKFINDVTIKTLKEKIKKHCKDHSIDKFSFVFHGGEPLLMPKNSFVNMLSSFNELKKENIDITYTVQTNGLLIDTEWCNIFNENEIHLGISIDGTENIHDENRVDKRGKGTYHKVIQKILFAQKKLKNQVGLLSVINLNLDPIDAYEHIKSLNVRSIDFLKLDNNYDTVPFDINNTPNANWYIKLFNKWFYEPETTRVHVRLFEIIIQNLIGGQFSTDSMGNLPNHVLVVETNGDLEAVDSLKICGESFTKNNINILSNDFEDALRAPLAEVYYNSGKYLSKKCLACPIQEICGGGYLAHRYSSKNGFNNPSIYCNDLLKLITHIQNAIIDEMPHELITETGIQKLTYEDAIRIIEETLPTISEPEYTEKLESFRNLVYDVV